MAVTAKFVPEQIDLLPNTPSTFALRLYNDDAATRIVTLAASGDLSEHVRFDSSTASVDTNQIVDVLVTAFVPATVEAGTYTISTDVAIDGEPPSNEPGIEAATATLLISAHSDYTIELVPSRSRGATAGRHLIRLANTGNVAATVALSAVASDEDLAVRVGESSMTVAPGLTGEEWLRVEPAATFWSGQPREYDFRLDATSIDGRSDTLLGTYQQRPRVPNWVGPAAAGTAAALLVGTIAWFAFLRPWVQDTADNAAADAIEQDRTALRERIDELEAAAADAKELPLGAPTDFRLDVAPAGGNSEQDVAEVEPGTIVSITDVVFENPTGAVGTVSLRRGDEVILQSELANFRDLDRHFVAPFQFDDDVEIVLDVDCRTPGAGESGCPVGVSLVGFVDEAN